MPLLCFDSQVLRNSDTSNLFEFLRQFKHRRIEMFQVLPFTTRTIPPEIVVFSYTRDFDPRRVSRGRVKPFAAADVIRDISLDTIRDEGFFIRREIQEPKLFFFFFFCLRNFKTIFLRSGSVVLNDDINSRSWRRNRSMVRALVQWYLVYKGLICIWNKRAKLTRRYFKSERAQ